MELNFTTTITISMNEIYGNINDFILKKLKEIYEGKCFEDNLITEIIKIVERSKLFIPNNEFGIGDYNCNIIFLAKCKKYEIGAILPVVVSNINNNNIAMCKHKYYEIAVNINNLKIAEGNSFLAYISKVDYNKGSFVSMVGTVFLPKYIITVANKIVIKDDSEIIKEEIKLIIEKIKAIKETPLIKKIKDKFISKKKSSFKFTKYCVFDNPAVKGDENEPVLYISSPYDNFFEGKFYIAPNMNLENNNKALECDGKFMLKTKGCTIYKAMSEQLNIIHTLSEAIAEWAEILENDKGFEKNKNIWALF